MQRRFPHLSRRMFVTFAILLVPAAMIGIVMARVPLSDVAAASVNAKPSWLLVAAGFMFGTGVLNALVLQRALSAAGMAPRFERTYLVQGASHGLASCAPTTLVDAARVWMLRGDAPVSRTVGALGSQKLIEAAAALCVVAAAGPFMQLPAEAQILRWAPLIFLCVAATTVALLILTPLGARLVRCVPGGRIGRLVRQVASGARSLAHVRTLLALLAAQAGALACRIGALWALLVAFSITSAPMGAVLVFVLLMVSAMVPSVGGAGAREAALVPALLLVFGVSTAEAFAFSLWIQPMGLITAAAMMGIYGVYRAARACVPSITAKATS